MVDSILATPLSLPDVLLIEPRVFGDDRGFFLETWSSRDFSKLGIETQFVQDNLSRSSRGVLRGIHYQMRHTQGKLVRCSRGSVFDVAVDLRRSSSTFGRWVGQILTEENKRSMWIPPGFGHGFLTLSDVADFQYKCSDVYDPESERTIAWNDPEIGIDWPIGDLGPIVLSEKDAGQGQALGEAEVFE